MLEEDLLRHLVKYAKRGEAEPLIELYSEAKRLSKTANSRLLRLERAGYDETSQAYSYATFYTSKEHESNRFRVNKFMTPDELAKEYRRMRLFMESKTSTVLGIRNAQKETFDTLRDYGYEVSNEHQEEIFKLLRSDEVQDLIEFGGEYEIVFDMILVNVSEQRKSVNDLKRQINAFLEGRENYDDFIERMGPYSYVEYHGRNRDRLRRSKRIKKA